MFSLMIMGWFGLAKKEFYDKKDYEDSLEAIVSRSLYGQKYVDDLIKENNDLKQDLKQNKNYILSLERQLNDVRDLELALKKFLHI